MTEEGLSAVIHDFSCAPSSQANVPFVSLLGRRGVGAELGANQCRLKGSNTVPIHARDGLYYTDQYSPTTHEVVSVCTIEDNTMRSREYEDNESYELDDEWYDGTTMDEDTTVIRTAALGSRSMIANHIATR